MVLTRSASSVLGKRAHQDEDDINQTSDFGKGMIPTTPEDDMKKLKRTRTTEEDFDSRANKENVPPDTNTDPTIRTPSLRRTATESSLVTPRSIRSLPRRTASTSKVSTPSRSTAALTVTPPPTPPKALRPIHVRVRGALRPTCDSPENSLQGRDEERSVISNFLSSFASGDNGCTKTSLYVSGSPGTGKTALMHELVRNFSVNEGIQVVYINCMGLKDVQAMHQRILEELPKSADSNRKLKGKAAVEHQLGAVSKRCVLVLDELDYLTSTSGALTAIFSLPQANNSKLRVIGIANTHTLTASLPLGEVDSVQTLHFKSYSSEELVQIINCRLSSLHADSTISESVKRMLPANALMLLSKKVATQTGDVRLLFEVLRGAIDRAVNVANKCADPLNTPAPVVTPAHILASLKASSHSVGASTGTLGSSSPGATALVMKVQELGFQPQLVLLMMILAYKRLEAGSSVSSTPLKNGVSSSASHNSIDAIQLHSYYTATLKRAVEATFSPASLSDFMDILGLLEGVGLIRLTSDCSTSRSLGSPSPSKRRKTLSRTASLSSGVLNRTQEVSIAEGVRIDEILRGLGVADDASKTPAKSDIMKEEVRALWRQECSRLAKEIKSREQSSLAKGNVDAAFEDARRSC